MAKGAEKEERAAARLAYLKAKRARYEAFEKDYISEEDKDIFLAGDSLAVMKVFVIVAVIGIALCVARLVR